MLEEKAIELIQSSETVSLTSKNIEQVGTKIPIIAHHKDVEIFNLEKFMENRANFGLLFKTDNVDSFVRYINTNKQEGTTCFIHGLEMSAKSIIDLGTLENPLHQYHQAKIHLLKTASYRKVCLVVDKERFHQREFSDFLEDWGSELTIIDEAGEEMTCVEAAKAVRTLKIDKENVKESIIGDYSHKQSEMEAIEANEKSRKVSEFVFTCEPYQGLGCFCFRFRVNLIINIDEAPTFSLRAVKFESSQEKIVKSFQEILENEIEGVDVYIGTAS